MKTAIDTSLRQNPLDSSVARDREKEHDAPDELWTLAVAQSLVEHLPRLTLPEALLGPTEAAPAPSAHTDDDAPARDELAADAALGARNAEKASSEPRGVPAELCAEVSDERFGRLRLHVARGERGLDIVINVADSRVKALIIAEQAILMKTLKEAGLRVASVQIGSPSRAGTALAVDRGGAEKPRMGASFHQPGARRRTYQGPLEEEAEDEADSEGLDFTA